MVGLSKLLSKKSLFLLDAAVLILAVHRFVDQSFDQGFLVSLTPVSSPSWHILVLSPWYYNALPTSLFVLARHCFLWTFPGLVGSSRRFQHSLIYVCLLHWIHTTQPWPQSPQCWCFHLLCCSISKCVKLFLSSLFVVVVGGQRSTGRGI